MVIELIDGTQIKNVIGVYGGVKLIDGVPRDTFRIEINAVEQLEDIVNVIQDNPNAIELYTYNFHLDENKNRVYDKVLMGEGYTIFVSAKTLEKKIPHQPGKLLPDSHRTIHEIILAQIDYEGSNKHNFSDEFTIDKFPTCTEEGEKSRHCSMCESRIDVTIIPRLEHDYGEDFIIDKEPTCTTDGEKSKHCSKCGKRMAMIPISRLGHNYTQDFVIDKEPTCTESGEQSRHCLRCDDRIGISEIKPLGHDFSLLYVTDKEATCTKDGIKSKHCLRCEERTDIRPIPKFGHRYKPEVTKLPMCTENGVRTYTCTTCGSSYMEEIAPLGHEYVEELTRQALCTQVGIKTFTCNRCRDKYIEEIPMTEHIYGDDDRCITCGKLKDGHTHVYSATITKVPTCTENGIKVFTCLCGATYTEEMPKTGHDFVGVITKEPTCTEIGVKTFTCTNCGNIYDEAIPEYGHEYNDDFTIDIQPTCISNGKKSRHCLRCDSRIEVSSIPKTGHIISTEIQKEATCTESGMKKHICTLCGETTYEEVLPLGHNYSTDYIVDVYPTCTSTGRKSKHCSRCDSIRDTVTLPKMGHNYVGSVTLEPTCTNVGIKTFTCTNCNDQYTTQIDALGHIPVDDPAVNPTCETDGKTSGVHCSRCNAIMTAQTAIPKLGHIWSGFTVIQNPTYNKNGIKRRTCSRCNKNDDQTIPKVTPNLAITTETIVGGIRDQSYSFQLQSNAPIASDVKWEVGGGNIPSGTTLSASGKLSGTPTSYGIFTFIIKATCYEQSVTKQYSVNISNTLRTVTFNPNGGTCTVTSKQVPEGSSIGALPTATKPGEEFGGWFTSATGGLRVDTSYNVPGDITLYARWGKVVDVEFGDVTTQFNIQYDGDRTNYNNNPYTLYSRMANGAAGTPNLSIQTGISSSNGLNQSNMTSTNKEIILFMKVTNNGDAGYFDIGFDCDSYVDGSDSVPVKRIANGVSLGSAPYYTVTVPYDHTAWVGRYSDRTSNRYNDSALNTVSNDDSGYAFTMNNIFINNGSYTILEVTFKRP